LGREALEQFAGHLSSDNPTFTFSREDLYEGRPHLEE
jgi:hypothetical protein